MSKIAFVLVLSCAALTACGGDEKRPPTPPAPSATPEPTTSASAAMPATSASAAPTASAKPAEPPPAPKATFTSAAKSANSGKVDKVGPGDGAFKGDGVKDVVLDVEYDGAATAFLVVTTDGSGMPNGEFTADTFVGSQTLPSEVGANLNTGKHTAGLAVYEGDKLLNGKDGALTALAEGKHKLAFHVSSKDAPTSGSYKVMALLPDKSLVSSSVVSLGDAKPDAKPAAAKPAPAGSAKK
jgi:hypothetical protein